MRRFHSGFRASHGLKALLLLSALLLNTPAQAQTIFTVTNTNNSGAGSLRQAILDADSTPNGGQPDEIHFDIDAQTDPGCDSATGVCAIAVLTALPVIDQAVILDGETQAGAECGADIPSRVLKIVLEGPGTGTGMNGLRLATNGSTVRGVVVNQFSRAGIVLSGPGTINNRIECNFIGTDVTGTQDLGNRDRGVRVENGASNNVIGGTAPEAGNLISGNGPVGIGSDGVLLWQSGTSGNLVQGNFIGTDVTGLEVLGNTGSGVTLLDVTNNTVGGSVPEARNLIAGNNGSNVYMQDAGTSGNVIQGNYIGTNLLTTGRLGNSTGVVLQVSPNNNVIEDNVITGGLILDGPENVIQGNFIGVDETGTLDLGHTGDGIRVAFRGENNTIGGAAPGDGNTIAFNDGVGINFLSGALTGNAILGNSLFENGGIGIDLGNDGPTANDPGDADGSPNNLQNFPDIADAFLVGSDLYVVYHVDSDPAHAAYPLTTEFFKADADGEEGQTLLGRDTFTGGDFNSSVNKTVNLGDAAGMTAGDFIVATTTDDDGNTSEFSFGAVEVSSASFALDLKRVFLKPSGKQKAKIKWTPADIDKNKIDFYIAENPDLPDPTGPPNKRVKTSKGKIKLTVPLGNGGPGYAIQACEKNSEAVCSNVVQADFSNALVIGPDDEDFYDDDEEDAYAGKAMTAAEAPSAFVLQGNYPNPFNPTTSIRIDLPERAEVSVAVYDLLGRRVLVVPARVLEAGAGRRVALDASRLATGTYLYRVTARTREAVHGATGRMVLVK